MKKILLITFIFFITLPVNANEYLSFNPGKNWDLGFSEAKNNIIMMEFVPKGETVNNWNKMITVQSLMGLQKKNYS